MHEWNRYSAIAEMARVLQSHEGMDGRKGSN